MLVKSVAGTGAVFPSNVRLFGLIRLLQTCERIVGTLASNLLRQIRQSWYQYAFRFVRVVLSLTDQTRRSDEVEPNEENVSKGIRQTLLHWVRPPSTHFIAKRLSDQLLERDRPTNRVLNI
jgi:hypothetical protein